MKEVKLTQWEKACHIFTYVFAGILMAIGALVCGLCISGTWYWIVLAGLIGLISGGAISTLVMMVLWTLWGIPEEKSL